jgi:hypothetical protein
MAVAYGRMSIPFSYLPMRPELPLIVLRHYITSSRRQREYKIIFKFLWWNVANSIPSEYQPVNVLYLHSINAFIYTIALNFDVHLQYIHLINTVSYVHASADIWMIVMIHQLIYIQEANRPTFVHTQHEIITVYVVFWRQSSVWMPSVMVAVMHLDPFSLTATYNGRHDTSIFITRA